MKAESFKTQSVPPSSKNLNDIEIYTRSPRRPLNGRLNPPQQISKKFVLHSTLFTVNAIKFVCLYVLCMFTLLS